MQCRNTTIEVDLSAIAENTRTLKRQLGSKKMLAVVKANAYGHGLLPVARTALQNGADMLGVAIPEEGITLRQGGIKAPILILGGVNHFGAEEAVRYHLTLTVFDPTGIKQLAGACQMLRSEADFHIKLDTGMGRIGARSEEEVRELLKEAEKYPFLHLTGAFTHFSDADGEEEDYTLEQMRRYETLCSLLPAGILHHAAASAGLLRFGAAHYDMVRAGIVLYGYAPVKTELKLRPALSFKSEVVFIKSVDAGDQLSYGRTFTAEGPMQVATVAVGYGDGYHRISGQKAYVLIRGHRCKVLGRVCMDQLLADVSGIDAEVGDEVVLLGKQGNEQIDAVELADWAGTICWEVLLSATARVPIHYIEQ